uniref:Sugar transporter SWEET n=1 Tax=Culicoides sonorensis TaxID=179676 RepID=A0A336LQ62_CULSO
MSSETSLAEQIGTLATITTCLQYLTGVLVCRDYVIKKSTGDASVLTFIAGFITSAIWLKYGLLTNERSLVIVNSIGVALMLAYTLVFYLFTTKRRDTIRIASSSFIFLCLVMLYASIEEDHLQATERIGFVGIGVSLLFFASPLANLAHVVRMKNSESLPFSMIVSSFVVTLLWFIYGHLIGDYFIQVPNFIGCVLLVLQLMLFVVYPSKSSVHLNDGYKPVQMLEHL